MNLLLFVVTIVISFVAVRIGAIAFELTGLEWSLAKFQALSCFSGTGFTTKEAELVVGHPQRRKIASILMVLGNAGIVTLVATFANSIRPSNLPSVELPLLHLFLPSFLVQWMNLAVIASTIYIMYRIFSYSKIGTRFTSFLRKKIVKKEIIKSVNFEELMVATGGYGVSSIEINKKSYLLGKIIRETDLRKEDIMIIAIGRKGHTIANPKADERILLDDKLMCFGKLDNIKRRFFIDEK